MNRPMYEMNCFDMRHLTPLQRAEEIKRKVRQHRELIAIDEGMVYMRKLVWR